MAVITAGADMSFNLLQALNSLRCGILSFGTNGWMLIAAIWYFAKEFGFEAEIKKYADEYYPYVCTCQEEASTMMKLMKATASAITVMSGCTAAAQKAAATKEAAKA